MPLFTEKESVSAPEGLRDCSKAERTKKHQKKNASFGAETWMKNKPGICLQRTAGLKTKRPGLGGHFQEVPFAAVSAEEIRENLEKTLQGNNSYI